MTALTIPALIIVAAICTVTAVACTLVDCDDDTYYPEQDSIFAACTEEEEQNPCEQKTV